MWPFYPSPSSLVRVSTQAWLQRGSGQIKPRWDPFPHPFLKEPPTPCFPLMWLRSEGFKVNIYHYSLVFGENSWFSPFLSFRLFWQTLITCIIQDRRRCPGVQKQARMKGRQVPPERPAGQTLRRVMKAQDPHVEPQAGSFGLWSVQRKRLWLILAHLPTWHLIPRHSWLPLAHHTSFFSLENRGKILRRFCFHVDINAALEMAFNWEGEGMTPLPFHSAVCALPGTDTFGKGTVSFQEFPLDGF